MSGRRAIRLVALREVRERIRSRVFLVSTLFMLLLVGGRGPDARSRGKQDRTGIAVTAPARRASSAALAARGEAVTTRRCGCASTRSAAAGGRRSRRSRSTRSCSCARPARLRVGRRREDGGDRGHRRALAPPPPAAGAGAHVGTLHPANDEARPRPRPRVAYIGSLLLLMSLAVYGQWVLDGVVEEKSSRVVELILSTVRPRHLLAGKVIGIGLLGFAQLALVAGLAAVLLVAGVFDAPSSLGGSVALVIPWFALGFALYAVAYAVAGALASRQQDASRRDAR